MGPPSHTGPRTLVFEAQHLQACSQESERFRGSLGFLRRFRRGYAQRPGMEEKGCRLGEGAIWETENLNHISSNCLPFQAVPQGAEPSRPSFETKHSR